MSRLARLSLLAWVACDEPPPMRSSSSTKPVETEAPKPPPPKTDPGAKLVWREQYSHHLEVVVEKTGVRAELRGDELRGEIWFENTPVGTKVKLGDEEKVAKDRYGGVKLRFDLTAQIVSLAPRVALNPETKLDPRLPLEITFPDGFKVSGAVPTLSVDKRVRAALREVTKKDKGLTFGADDAAPKPRAGRTTIYLDGSFWADTEVVGNAKTLRDVDLVATSSNLPPRPGNMKCGGYGYGYKGGNITKDLVLVDAEIRVYDRRTSKVIDRKTIQAPHACPSTALDKVSTTSSRPEDAAIVWWLASRG